MFGLKRLAKRVDEDIKELCSRLGTLHEHLNEERARIFRVSGELADVRRDLGKLRRLYNKEVGDITRGNVLEGIENRLTRLEDQVHHRPATKKDFELLKKSFIAAEEALESHAQRIADHWRKAVEKHAERFQSQLSGALSRLKTLEKRVKEMEQCKPH